MCVGVGVMCVFMCACGGKRSALGVIHQDPSSILVFFIDNFIIHVICFDQICPPFPPLPLFPPNFKCSSSLLKSTESTYYSMFLGVGPSTRARVAFQGHIPKNTDSLHPDSPQLLRTPQLGVELDEPFPIHAGTIGALILCKS